MSWVLWCNPSLILIKAICSLHHSSPSFGLYLARNTSENNFLAVQCFAGSWWTFSLHPLPRGIHHDWIWAFCKPFLFRNAPTMSSSHNNLTFIKICQIFLLITVAFNTSKWSTKWRNYLNNNFDVLYYILIRYSIPSYIEKCKENFKHIQPLYDFKKLISLFNVVVIINYFITYLNAYHYFFFITIH